MQFTPRRISREVNVSPEHPLREFVALVGGVLVVLLVVYVGLGFVLDLVVLRIDPATERRLGDFLLPASVPATNPTPAEALLQNLLDDLAAPADGGAGTFRVHLAPSLKANAMAFPGGRIVVLSGLVRKAQSENEVAMILGHEIGHFRNRDHLRGLGRGLVLVFLSSLLFGPDSAASSLASSLLGGAEMRFSQSQELQADACGLDLLVRRYGHAGGATDFFRRLDDQEHGRKASSMLASHPYPESRVAALENAIRERGFPVLQTTPLDPAVRAAAAWEGNPGAR